MATEPTLKASWTPIGAPWRGLTWLVGGLAALLAALVAVVLAVVFFVVAVCTAVLLTLRVAFGRPRVRPRPDDPTLIEAHRTGGHSWVAYCWDGPR